MYINKIEKIIAELEEIIKQSQIDLPNKKQEIIRVPDSIKIERDMRVYGDQLGIVFDNDCTMTTKNGKLRVVSSTERDFCSCQLIPIDPKDRKIDYTYFRSSYKIKKYPKIVDMKRCYCKYIGNNKCIFVGETVNIKATACFSDKYWYQVIPLED